MTEFQTWFNLLVVCNQGPEAFPRNLLDSTSVNEVMRWRVAVQDGVWVAGVSSGGCRDYPGQYESTFLNSVWGHLSAREFRRLLAIKAMNNDLINYFINSTFQSIDRSMSGVPGC